MIKYALEQGEADPNALQVAAHKYLSPILERETMTTAQQLRQEGRQEGLHQGFEQTLLALGLLKEGKRIDEVAQETGLSIAEISKLKASL